MLLLVPKGPFCDQRLRCKVKSLFTRPAIPAQCLPCQLSIVSSVSELGSVVPRNVEGKTSKQLFNYQPRAQIWQLTHSLLAKLPPQ